MKYIIIIIGDIMHVLHPTTTIVSQFFNQLLSNFHVLHLKYSYLSS